MNCRIGGKNIEVDYSTLQVFHPVIGMERNTAEADVEEVLVIAADSEKIYN